MGHTDWEYTRQLVHANGVSLEQPMEGTPDCIASMYREREKKLARLPDRTGSTTSTAPVLVFRLDKERYGIELADISAVLGTMRCTPVPESEPNLEGLINVNGTIRPVLNLRFLLDLPAAGPQIPVYFLLLRQRERELGVKVEEIECVCPVARQDPPTTAGDPVAPGIRGFTSDTLTVLRTNALFAEFWSKTSQS